jgi:hypothetical protein
MGLLTILKKVKQKEKELRILILGLDNAGATRAMSTNKLFLFLFLMRMYCLPFLRIGKTTILRKFNGEDINEVTYCAVLFYAMCREDQYIVTVLF